MEHRRGAGAPGAASAARIARRAGGVGVLAERTASAKVSSEVCAHWPSDQLTFTRKSSDFHRSIAAWCFALRAALRRWRDFVAGAASAAGVLRLRGARAGAASAAGRVAGSAWRSQASSSWRPAHASPLPSSSASS